MGTTESHPMQSEETCLATGAPSLHNTVPIQGVSPIFWSYERGGNPPASHKARGSGSLVPIRDLRMFFEIRLPLVTDKTVIVTSYLDALVESVQIAKCKVFFLCPPGRHTPDCKVFCGWLGDWGILFLILSSKCPP